MMDALIEFDSVQEIGAMVLTGNDKSFAAGADITNMVDSSEDEIRKSPFIPAFDRIREVSKPIVAAVSGYCLGGGNELAMSCDLIVASESAVFGQPEINLGVIPGAGGTQRLTLSVGKALAMEMILNDRKLSSQEALQYGLVNHVYPIEEYLSKSISLAQSLAERAPLAVKSAKEMVNQTFEVPLTEGLKKERDSFYHLFSSQDQEEGMKAFLEKRSPTWKGV
jgi:enoyl-CoA hydratase